MLTHPFGHCAQPVNERLDARDRLDARALRAQQLIEELDERIGVVARQHDLALAVPKVDLHSAAACADALRQRWRDARTRAS
jgi:hypothetical protein